MKARLIDGRAKAEQLQQMVADQVTKLAVKPGLAVVLVGSDPASEIYVKSKIRRTKEVGMKSFFHFLESNTSEEEIITLIEHLNNDPEVHGILVQLPLPAHINQVRVIEKISPSKDVDGFTVTNAGRLANRLPSLTPCTPLGCLMLIEDAVENLEGKVVAIIGSSNVVGRPLIQLMLKQNCTVLVIHRYTQNPSELVRTADIVVVAAGVPGLVRGNWVKPGAVVIDVGINRITEGNHSLIVGDVAFDEVVDIASAITPVPGGVGPMTIACLLSNTLSAYSAQTSKQTN